MRQALMLLSTLILMIVTAPAPAAVAQPGDAGRYRDPQGRFTVAIPTNWRAENRPEFGVLLDPEGEITVYLLAVAAADAETGVAAAWAVVDPSFAREPGERTRLPAPSGVEQMVSVIYVSPDPNQIVIGLGQLVNGVVYAILIDGSLEAIARRGSQLDVIVTGFTIAAVEQTDLSGMMPRQVTPELLAELEAYISAIMPRHGAPGAAVAIVQDGRVMYARGFGVRDIDGSSLVTADTLMMIGSTSKTMTTMMMATLVDEGRMTWDTPVVDILPGFALSDSERTRRVTVRNLVCACTGVPRRDLELIFNAASLSAEQIVESLAGFRLFTEFGEAFQYSNQMVAAAGYVATLAAGGRYGGLLADYQAEMQRRVFDPIGMTSSTFSFDRVRAAADRATPHGRRLSGEYQPLPLSHEALLLPVAPAGAVWSTATDMARYLITDMQRGVSPDGRRVVSETQLLQTWEPQVAVSAETSYGLGWFVERYKGVRVLHHGGNTFGFTSDLAFLPDAGLGIVVLSNAQGSIFNQAVRARLFELVYNLPSEYEQVAAFAQEETRRSIADANARLAKGIDADAVAPFLGAYRNEALGAIVLSLQDGRLLLDAGEFTGELRRLVSDSGRVSYVVIDPPLAGIPFLFQLDGSGNPTIVLPNLPDTYLFRRSDR